MNTVQPQASPTKPLSLQFTGTAKEYFNIWIVNIFLTIITLGIYSAWAKVRRKRYFYGNTLLQGTSFEYLGDPGKILKGRLMVVGLFVAYLAASLFVPGIEQISGLLFLAIVPWLVVKARIFNTRNSSYRNIRLDFRAPWDEAYLVLLALPLLAGVTLGLAYPYFVYRRSKFLVDHSGYGTTSFVYRGYGWNQYKTFLAIYVAAGLMCVGFGLVALFVVMPALPRSAFQDLFILSLAGLLGLLAMYAYVKTAITNFVWSNISIADARFESTLRTGPMIWLYLSNAIGILVSLGLLIPWASIRMVRYRLANLQLWAASELTDFVAGQQEKVSAAGEEISEFYDVDVGL